MRPQLLSRRTPTVERAPATAQWGAEPANEIRAPPCCQEDISAHGVRTEEPEFITMEELKEKMTNIFVRDCRPRAFAPGPHPSIGGADLEWGNERGRRHRLHVHMYTRPTALCHLAGLAQIAAGV